MRREEEGEKGRRDLKLTVSCLRHQTNECLSVGHDFKLCLLSLVLTRERSGLMKPDGNNTALDC